METVKVPLFPLSFRSIFIRLIICFLLVTEMVRFRRQAIVSLDVLVEKQHIPLLALLILFV